MLMIYIVCMIDMISFIISRHVEGPGREILKSPPPPPVCLSVRPSRLVFAPCHGGVLYSI